jgi:hypothetical protein
MVLAMVLVMVMVMVVVVVLVVMKIARWAQNITVDTTTIPSMTVLVPSNSTTTPRAIMEAPIVNIIYTMVVVTVTIINITNTLLSNSNNNNNNNNNKNNNNSSSSHKSSITTNKTTPQTMANIVSRMIIFCITRTLRHFIQVHRRICPQEVAIASRHSLNNRSTLLASDSIIITISTTTSITFRPRIPTAHIRRLCHTRPYLELCGIMVILP